jgi:hypothetical protein
MPPPPPPPQSSIISVVTPEGMVNVVLVVKTCILCPLPPEEPAGPTNENPEGQLPDALGPNNVFVEVLM